MNTVVSHMPELKNVQGSGTFCEKLKPVNTHRHPWHVQMSHYSEAATHVTLYRVVFMSIERCIASDSILVGTDSEGSIFQVLEGVYYVDPRREPPLNEPL